MKKVLKITGLILGSLILLLALVLFLLPYFLNLEKIRHYLAQELSTRLQAKVSVAEVRLRFLPTPRVKVKNLKVEGKKFVFDLRAGDLILRLAPLFRKEIVVEKCKLEGPVLTLLTRAPPEGAPPKEAQAGFKELFPKLETLLTKVPEITIEFEDATFKKQKGPEVYTLLTETRGLLGLKKEFLELELSGQNRALKKLTFTLKLWPKEALLEGLVRVRHADLEKLPPLKEDWPLERLKTDLNLDLSYRFEEGKWLLGFTATAPCLVRQKNPPLFFDCSALIGQASYQPGELKVEIKELVARHPLLEARGLFVKNPQGSRFDFFITRGDWEEIKKRLFVFLEKNRGFLRFAEIVQAGLAYETHFKSQAPTVKALFKLENLTYVGQAQEARIKVPKLDLLLTRVSGKVAVEKGKLTVKDAKAHYQDLLLREATLTLPLTKLKDSRAKLHFAARFAGPFPRLQEVLFRLPLPDRIANEIKALSGQGQLSGRVKVEGLLRHPQVAFALHPQDLALRYQRFPLPLRLRGGTISYAKKEIVIKGVTVNTPQSRLTLRFRLRPFIKPWWLELKEARGELSLKELNLLLSHYPQTASYLEQVSLEGEKLIIKEASFRGPLEGLALLTKAYLKAEGKGLTFSYRGLPQPLYFKRVTLSYTNYRFSFEPSQVECLDGTFTFTGELGLKPFSLFLNGSGKAGKDFVNWVFKEAHLPEKFFPRVPLRLPSFEFMKSPEELKFLGKIETVAPSWVNLVYEKKTPGFAFSATLFPQGKETFRLKVSKEDDKFALALKGRLSSEDLKLFLKQNPFLLQKIETDLEGLFDPQTPARSFFFGRLKLSGFQVPYRGLLFQIETLDLRAEKRKVFLTESLFKFNGTTFKTQGVVTFSQKYLSFDGSAYAPEIDVTKLLKAFAPEKKEETAAKHPQPKIKLVAHLDLEAEKVFYRGYEFSPFRGAVFYHPGQLKVVVEETSLCGIKIIGEIGRQKDQRRLVASFTEPKGAWEKTLFCLFQRKDLRGPFELKGEIIATGQERLFEKTQGYLYLRSKKGHIDKFGTLAKLFALLSPIDIFSGNLPDFSEKGMDFDLLEVKGKFKKDYLKIEALQLNAPGLRFFGTGKVYFLDQKLDLILLVSPFKTFNAVVSKVPLLGWILTGESKMLLAVPVKITGPFKDPTVVPLDPVSLGSQFLGIVGRTFKLPVKILTPKTKNPEGAK